MMQGFTLHPRLDTPAIGLRIHFVAAGLLSSIATVGSSLRRSMEAGLRLQAPPRLELVALCSLSTV